MGALVTELESDRTVVRLVNLSPVESRTLVIQAGTFGEHSFGRATYQVRTSEWPGELGGYAGTYAAPPVTTEDQTIDVKSRHLAVELPPAQEITLDLTTDRYVNEPSYHNGPYIPRKDWLAYITYNLPIKPDDHESLMEAIYTSGLDEEALKTKYLRYRELGSWMSGHIKSMSDSTDG